MKLNLDEITVKIKFIGEKKTKAIIGLNLGDFVVKGFRVIESQYENFKGDKLWLVPPSYPDSSGKYHPIFFAPNKELWGSLQLKIWEEYYRQSEEYYKKRFDLGEDDS